MTLLLLGLRKIWHSVGVLAPLVVVLLVISFVVGGTDLPVAGLWKGLGMLWDILPRFLIAFALTGLIQVMIPGHLVRKWLGNESGLKGITIGAAVGGITPGGPYLFLPVVAGLMRQGAGVGSMGAFLGGKTYLNVMHFLTWEAPIIGLALTLSKHLATCLFPVATGLLVVPVFQLLERGKAPKSTLPSQD